MLHRRMDRFISFLFGLTCLYEPINVTGKVKRTWPDRDSSQVSLVYRVSTQNSELLSHMVSLFNHPNEKAYISGMLLL